MAVTTDIFESWLRPRLVVGRLLARERSEPFALSLLLTFLLLALVASLPNLARQGFLDGGTPLAPRVLGAALGLLATLPGLYLLAAIGSLIARRFGAGASYYGGRIAMFWALLAATPGMLVVGLMQGMLGPATATVTLSLAVVVVFLVFWVIGLKEASK